MFVLIYFNRIPSEIRELQIKQLGLRLKLTTINLALESNLDSVSYALLPRGQKTLMSLALGVTIPEVFP